MRAHAAFPMLFLALCVGSWADDEKVAQGEYVAAFALEVPGGQQESVASADHWSLWKRGEGYEAEGRFALGSSAEPADFVGYRASLTGDLRPVSYTLLLPGGSGKGHITCTFGRASCGCHGTDVNGKTLGGSYTPQGRFAFLGLGPSWTLSGIAAMVKSEPEGQLSFELVSLDDGGAEGEIVFTSAAATARYAGREATSVFGKSISLHRYEVRSTGFELDFWTSDKGLVLAYQEAKTPQMRWELRTLEDNGGLALEVN